MRYLALGVADAFPTPIRSGRFGRRSTIAPVRQPKTRQLGGQLLINNLLSELDRLRAGSGTNRERVVREAFKDLL